MRTKPMGWFLAIAVVLTFLPPALATEVQGSIRTVYPVDGRIVLENGSTIAVNEDTQITIAGKQGTLAELLPGERIKAHYRSENNENVATLITVLHTPVGSSIR